MNNEHMKALRVVAALPKISKITDSLFIGSWPTETVKDFKYIVACCPHRKPYSITSDQELIQGYLFDAAEIHDLNEVYRLVLATEEMSKKGQVLVHCKGGINRSSFIVALVLVREGMTPENAIKLIRNRRHSACLNNKTFEQFILDYK